MKVSTMVRTPRAFSRPAAAIPRSVQASEPSSTTGFFAARSLRGEGLDAVVATGGRAP